MTYQSSYELDVDIGFALLEQIEDTEGIRQYRYTPDHGDFEDMLLAGVYGGHIDPDRSQEFFVYDLEWPEQLQELDEDVLDVLTSELDSLFPGWVLDQDENKVYVLQDPEAPAAPL